MAPPDDPNVTLFSLVDLGVGVVFEPADEEPEEFDPEAEQRAPEADGLTIPSVDEPEEYDPEADQHDPEADGLTIPRVETDESDAPRELVRTFWAIVIVLNAAILAVSVGLMVLYFWGDLRRGGILILGGLVLFGFAYRRIRTADLEAIGAGSVSPDEDGVSGSGEGSIDADVEGVDATSESGVDDG